MFTSWILMKVILYGIDLFQQHKLEFIYHSPVLDCFQTIDNFDGFKLFMSITSLHTLQEQWLSVSLTSCLQFLPHPQHIQGPQRATMLLETNLVKTYH